MAADLGGRLILNRIGEVGGFDLCRVGGERVGEGVFDFWVVIGGSGAFGGFVGAGRCIGGVARQGLFGAVKTHRADRPGDDAPGVGRETDARTGELSPRVRRTRGFGGPVFGGGGDGFDVESILPHGSLLMKTRLFAAAICVLGPVVAVCHADDFSALMADLSFSAVPSYAANPPAAKASPPVGPTELIGGLRQAPSQRADAPARSQAKLQAPRFDIDAAMASQEASGSVDVSVDPPTFSRRTPAASVACRMGGMGRAVAGDCVNECCDGGGSCDGAMVACDAGGCGGGCGGNCGDQRGCRHRKEKVIVCTPKDPVRLPTSTFLQYFNARPTDVHVWDGYTQRPCKLYEGEEPAPHSRDCLCSGCGGCGEVLPPCGNAKSCLPNVRMPIRAIQPACDSCDSCD